MTICYHVSAVIYNRCSYAGCTDTGFFTCNDLFNGSWIIGVFLFEIIVINLYSFPFCKLIRNPPILKTKLTIGPKNKLWESLKRKSVFI